jgi:hypothetical protein
MDEVDAFLASDEDVDAFLSDDADPLLDPKPRYDDFIGPDIGTEEIGRVRGTVAQRAMNALAKMKAGSKLEPDEADAVRQMLGENAKTPAERLRTAEREGRTPLPKAQAMALGNTLTAGMGQRVGELLKPVGDAFGDAIGIGHDKRSIAEQTRKGATDHPGTTAAYGFLGRVGAGAMAGNTYTGQAVSGAAQGYNDAGPGVLDKIVGTGAGALAGVVGKGIGDYAPAELHRLAQKAKGGAGKGMESLARLLGFNGPKLSSQADDGAALAHQMTDFVPPDSPDVQLGRQMEDELRRMANSPRTAEEYTAGRTLPEAFDDIARDVNAVGKGNVRPGDWQPVPKEKVDMEALERLTRRQNLDDYYRHKAEMDELNAEIAKKAEMADTVANKQHRISSGNPVAPDAATKAARPGAADPATQVMSPDDVGQLKQRALMDNIAKVQDIQPYDSGLPIENWSAAPRKQKNAFDVIAQADNLGAPPAQPAAPVSTIDPRRQKIIDAQMAHPEALAAFDVPDAVAQEARAQSRAPNPVRFKNKQEAWNKLRDTAGIDGGDTSAADAAYERFLRGEGPKPPPFEGGHLDRINQLLNLEGDKRVSGAREAFDRLTKGRRSFDDINTAIRELKDVPGFEGLRIPDDAQEAMINKGAAAADASFDFGANVDPRKGERGFDGLGALAGYYGIKKGVDTAKAAAPMVGQLGQSMQQSARQSLSPDAMARRAVSDPAIILQLVREGGVLGAAAQSMLAALQAGDQAGLKARAALLGTMPEFRQKFAQGTAGQGPAMSAASGF